MKVKVTELNLGKFSFIGKISKMGDNKVIWISKDYHDKITELGFEGKGKQVRITIDDEI